MTTRDDVATQLPWDPADPYPFYEAQRRRGGVVWDESAAAWLVLGYHPAHQVLSGSGWTSDPLANPNTPTALRRIDPDVLHRNMLTVDGADHHRLRGSVRDVFGRRFVAGLHEGIEAITAHVLDAIPTGSSFEFMADVALPLPVSVAAAWLDLDVGAAALLREESPAIARMLGDIADPATLDAGTAAFATLLTELLPHAADRRVHPRDDLISFIGADPALDLDDVVTTAIVIAVAGHETTANALGAAMIRLLTPDQAGRRPVDGLDAIDEGACTELLRLDGPVQAVARTATTDHVVDGVTIRAGEPALVVLAAANRDPAVFSDPDEFVPKRTGPAPLTFGHGAHHCLGVALARLELAIALRTIVARRPMLVGTPTWRDTPAIRGPLTVPMVLTS